MLRFGLAVVPAKPIQERPPMISLFDIKLSELPVGFDTEVPISIALGPATFMVLFFIMQ